MHVAEASAVVADSRSDHRRDARAPVSESAETILLPRSEVSPAGIEFRAWQPGETVIDDAYIIERELARGGMGIVYQAAEAATGALVVIKCPLLDSLGNPEMKRRFFREAEEWMRLGRHPHVVRALAVHDVEWTIVIVAEWIDGGSLHERLRAGPLPLPEGLAIAVQIAHGMAYAHAHGIIHRDLKPANVLLTHDGVAKVTDFGLVRRDDRKDAPLTPAIPATASPELTIGILGTPEYLAPEQWEERATKASDIYAFGVTLYELFCGRRPFDFSHVEDLPTRVTSYQEAHCVQAPSDPRESNETLPEALSDMILRCLAKDPAARPASFEELADELNAQLEQAGGRAVPRPSGEQLDQSSLLDRAHSLLRMVSPALLEAEFDKARGLLREVEPVLLSQGNDRDLSLYWNAVCHARVYEPGETGALDALAKAEVHAARSGDDRLRVSIAINRGNWHRNHREDDPARRCYEQAGEIARAAGLSMQEARIHGNIGMLDLSAGRHDAALEHFEASERLFERGKAWLSLSGISNCIGNVHYARRDFERAAQCYRHALDISRQLGDSNFQGMAWMNLAGAQGQMKEIDAGLASAGEALRCFQRIRKSYWYCRALGIRANLHILRRDMTAARADLEECLAIARERKDRDHIAPALCGLSSLAVSRGDAAESLRLAREAERELKGLKDPALLDLVTFTRGRALALLGRHAEAREALEECLRLRRSTSHHDPKEVETELAKLPPSTP